jgi:hypothetical protein
MLEVRLTVRLRLYWEVRKRDAMVFAIRTTHLKLRRATGWNDVFLSLAPAFPPPELVQTRTKAI